MKFLFIFICILASQLMAQVKPVFEFQENRMQLLDMTTLTQSVWHNDSIAMNDNEKIKLFKSYFKPTSYSAYKDFFLTVDWPGISPEEYQQWQNTIAVKRLLLQNVVHLKDPVGGEFLIFQYIMDGPAYAVYNAVGFKKTPSGWKHIHQKNDDSSPCLMRIGAIEIAYLQKLISDSSEYIQVGSIPQSHIRSNKEKFNRKDLFNQIETLLVEKGVSKTDRDLARTYFEYKDDSAFFESICKKYNLDDITLMGEINQAAGMQIYNFSKRQND